MLAIFANALNGLGSGVILLGKAISQTRLSRRDISRFLEQILIIGNASLPMTALLSMSIGGVMALQTGTTLAEHGLQDTLGGIVGLSVAWEIGPLIISILLAGRVGSAIAAELGSMSVYSEIDALRTMNIHPVRFLVTPRLWAAAVITPVLVIVGDVMGWTGGALAGAFTSGVNLPFERFLHGLRESVRFQDIGDGIIKAVFFAVAMAISCCYVGLQTRGGPREIGKSVTKGVVASLVLILLLDYFLTRILIEIHRWI